MQPARQDGPARRRQTRRGPARRRQTRRGPARRGPARRGQASSLHLFVETRLALVWFALVFDSSLISPFRIPFLSRVIFCNSPPSIYCEETSFPRHVVGKMPHKKGTCTLFQTYIGQMTHRGSPFASAQAGAADERDQ